MSAGRSVRRALPFACSLQEDRSSLRLTRLMLARTAGPQQSVRLGFDGLGKLLEVFAHMPEVFQHLIDILGVHVQRLINTRCEVSYIRQRFTQFYHGFP